MTQSRRQRFLAVDYGLARTGFAVNFATLAEPLETVSSSYALTRLSEFVAEYGVTEVLVGKPDGVMASPVDEFVRQIREELPAGVTVREIDETLSTKEADRKQAESGASLQKRREARDHLAAAGMLQWFLDTEKPNVG